MKTILQLIAFVFCIATMIILISKCKELSLLSVTAVCLFWIYINDKIDSL